MPSTRGSHDNRSRFGVVLCHPRRPSLFRLQHFQIIWRVRCEKLRRVVRRGERDRIVELVQVSAVNISRCDRCILKEVNRCVRLGLRPSFYRNQLLDPHGHGMTGLWRNPRAARPWPRTQAYPRRALARASYNPRGECPALLRQGKLRDWHPVLLPRLLASGRARCPSNARRRGYHEVRHHGKQGNSLSLPWIRRKPSFSRSVSSAAKGNFATLL